MHGAEAFAAISLTYQWNSETAKISVKYTAMLSKQNSAVMSSVARLLTRVNGLFVIKNR